MSEQSVPASAVPSAAGAADAAPAASSSSASSAAAPVAAVAAKPAVHEAQRFLQEHKEKLQMNQYWYSLPTIAAMVGEVERESKRACFLSTPSIFFSLNDKALQANSRVLDFDEMWAAHPGFVKYDFKKADEIPKSLHHSFDFIVIDPPFITAEVWADYAKAAKMLLVEGTEEVEIDTALAEQYHASCVRAHTAAVASLRGDVVGTSFAGNIASMLGNVLGGGDSSAKKSDAAAAAALKPPSAPRPSAADPSRALVTVPRGKLLLSTIPEHEGYLHALLGVSQPRFRPSIPNLIYQYSLYVNYPSQPLNKLNPEIDDEPVVRATSRKKNVVLGV